MLYNVRVLGDLDDMLDIIVWQCHVDVSPPAFT